MFHTVCPICQSPDLKPLLTAQDYTVSGELFDIHFCDKCQTGITQNVPENIGKYYQSTAYVSHSNTKKGLINQLYHLARQLMLRQKTSLVQRLNGSERGSLLDIGTGTGYFLNEMKQLHWDVKGIEADEATRNFAIQTFDLEVLAAEKLFTDTLPTFDAITLWHVLEHLPDLPRHMATIKNLLKPNGHLIIAVPNHWASEQPHYQQFWAAWDVPRHLWHFSPLSLQTLCQRTGFQVVSQKIMPFDPFYIAWLSEKYQQKPLAFLGGMWRGFWSFLSSMIDVKRSSSVIYIIRHA